MKSAMKNIQIQNCVFRYEVCEMNGILLNVSIEISTMRNNDSSNIIT